MGSMLRAAGHKEPLECLLVRERREVAEELQAAGRVAVSRPSTLPRTGRRRTLMCTRKSGLAAIHLASSSDSLRAGAFMRSRLMQYRSDPPMQSKRCPGHT
jgi:hypothetical protein